MYPKIYIYMYMERSDGACTDADSYARTPTEQSGTRPQKWSSLGNGESDRSCTVL